MRTTKKQRAREDSAAVAGTGPRTVSRSMIEGTIRSLEANVSFYEQHGKHRAAAKCRALLDDSRRRLAEYGREAA